MKKNLFLLFRKDWKWGEQNQNKEKYQPFCFFKKTIMSTLVLFLPLIIRFFFSFWLHSVILWWLRFMVDNLIQYTFNAVISIWKITFPTLGWCSFSQKINRFYCLKKIKNKRRKTGKKIDLFFKNKFVLAPFPLFSPLIFFKNHF
jgi:hypothetical protein